MSKLISSLIILLICISGCVNLVDFEEPQPIGKRDLSHFPSRLVGQYVGDGNISIIISSNAILELYEVEMHTILDSLDFVEIDSSKIINEVLHIIEDDSDITLKFDGDSVHCKVLSIDTMFVISPKGILRKMKGHYFLNKRNNSALWNVQVVSLTKGELSIAHIDVPEKIDQLKVITEVEEVLSDKGKVIKYHINPTKKEMIQLLQKSFSSEGTYGKIK